MQHDHISRELSSSAGCNEFHSVDITEHRNRVLLLASQKWCYRANKLNKHVIRFIQTRWYLLAGSRVLGNNSTMQPWKSRFRLLASLLRLCFCDWSKEVHFIFDHKNILNKLRIFLNQTIFNLNSKLLYCRAYKFFFRKALI